MSLSPMELVENDCGTNHGLEITVFSKKHAETLEGKYFRHPDDPNSDWQLLDYETAKSLINRKIKIRSPMCCQTSNMRICKKCFGEREYPTKYVGIVAGQVVAERLTQLVMRSFHTSGSADLTVNNDTVQFLKDHLMDIENADTEIRLKFDTNNISDKILSSITGFNHINDNIAIFEPVNELVANNDTVFILQKIQELMKTRTKDIMFPNEYYETLMSYVLDVGCPYSSFVEMVFANTFLVNVDDREEFWRYYQNHPIVKKLGDKQVASKISSNLGCLYQPNKQTLSNVDTFIENGIENLTVYEKLWMNIFDI